MAEEAEEEPVRELPESFADYEPDPSVRGEPVEHAVRAATHADVGPCVRLAALVAEGPADRWATLFQRDIAQSRHHLVVAEHAGELIGYGRTVWFEPGDDAPDEAAPAGYYLMGLVVAPDWRRRGVAATLTRARLDWVAQRASEAWFIVDRDNPASVDLHLRAGFQLVGGELWFPGVTDGATSHALGRVQLR